MPTKCYCMVISGMGYLTIEALKEAIKIQRQNENLQKSTNKDSFKKITSNIAATSETTAVALATILATASTVAAATTAVSTPPIESNKTPKIQTKSEQKYE